MIFPLPRSWNDLHHEMLPEAHHGKTNDPEQRGRTPKQDGWGGLIVKGSKAAIGGVHLSNHGVQPWLHCSSLSPSSTISSLLPLWIGVLVEFSSGWKWVCLVWYVLSVWWQETTLFHVGGNMQVLFGIIVFVGFSGDNTIKYWVKPLPSSNPHKPHLQSKVEVEYWGLRKMFGLPISKLGRTFERKKSHL
jgi:hypothetical protein